MTSDQFCYWLHGFMELTEEHRGLTPNQVKVISDHLDLVFKKVTQERIRPSTQPFKPLYPPFTNDPFQPYNGERWYCHSKPTILTGDLLC
jgi:hypothetical protein